MFRDGLMSSSDLSHVAISCFQGLGQIPGPLTLHLACEPYKRGPARKNCTLVVWLVQALIPV